MTDLTERYGGRIRTPGSAESTVPGRVWWIAVIALATGVIVFWALFALNPASTVEAQTASFSAADDHSASIDARVSVQPGTPLACAVQAQNERSTIVGFKVVELPPVDEAHQRIQVDLRTTQRASLVQVRECWIVGDERGPLFPVG